MILLDNGLVDRLDGVLLVEDLRRLIVDHGTVVVNLRGWLVNLGSGLVDGRLLVDILWLDWLNIVGVHWSGNGDFLKRGFSGDKVFCTDDRVQSYGFLTFSQMEVQ